MNKYLLALLFVISFSLLNFGNNETEILKDSLSSFHGLKKANSLYLIANNYFPNNNDSALKYSEEALSEYQNIEYEKGVISCFGLIAVIYSGYGLYDTAIALNYKVIEWGGENNDITSFAYLELANTYKNMNESAKAKEFYLKAINGTYLPAKMAAFANMGLLYLGNENYDSASYYFNRSLQNYYKTDTSLSINKYNIAIINLNLATVNYGYGEYKKGIKLLEKSLRTFNEINNKAITANVNFRLGEGYDYMQENELAIQYYLKAKEISDLHKTPLVKEKVYFKLFEYYKEKGDFEKAVIHLIEYEKVHDSLIIARNKSSIAEIETKYSLKEKTSLINELQTEKQILRIRSILIIAALLSISLLIIILINQRRLKLKSAKALADARSNISRIKTEVAEQELKRIVASLHEKSAFIEELQEEINKLGDIEDQKHMEEKVQLLRKTRILTDEDWEEYNRIFNELHPAFCNSILNYNDLSIGDKRQLIFLKLGLNQKETAYLMGISTEGVKRARQRLSKKIGINNAGELKEYIEGL